MTATQTTSKLEALGFTATQIIKAHEALEDGALVRTAGRDLFQIVSGDGSTTYLTAPDACSCPAGRNGRRCYHRAAAILASAA